jgi:hypothetical protein
MNCIEARKRIDELLDGDLTAAEELELRRHLQACSACARHEQGLRSVAREAAGLPEAIEPPTDLWHGIDRRIDGGGAEPSSARPVRSGLRRQVLVAASLFVVLTAAAIVTWRDLRGPDADRTASPVADTRPAASPAPTVGYGEAEEAFRRASRDLRALLAERRSNLPPRTAAAIDRDLALTDEAIDAITAELRKNPGSHELNRLLRAQYQRQLHLLQRVTEGATRL